MNAVPLTVDELQSLVEKLPRTKDGVHVGSCDIVWYWTGNRYLVKDFTFAEFSIDFGNRKTHHRNRRRVGDQDYLYISECYSTRELAVANHPFAGMSA